MMNKRNFFKFLAISPVAVPMTAVAMAREGDEPHQGELSITLQGSKPPRKVETKYPHIGGLNFNLHEMDPNIKVSLSVGQDGHLWLRAGNEEKWKRVVAE